jgi:hypothetical protein
MLNVKEHKSLISKDVKDKENLFSVMTFANEAGNQGFHVEMDMEAKCVVLELRTDVAIMITLDPVQAVSLGMWLAEAGHILNFAKSINLTLEDDEEISNG